MALYRCFFIDSNNHIFGPPEIIEADDDEAAIDRAQRLCDENPGCRNIELWYEARHVRRLDRAI
jgi:hypothetical protein